MQREIQPAAALESNYESLTKLTIDAANYASLRSRQVSQDEVTPQKESLTVTPTEISVLDNTEHHPQVIDKSKYFSGEGVAPFAFLEADYVGDDSLHTTMRHGLNDSFNF